MSLPPTACRVTWNTDEAVNQQIRRDMEARVAECARRGPAAIQRRLGELDAEWDIERTLEANASSLILVGLILGKTVDRKFYLLPAGVAAFLLQHALQGWCPPLPVFRRLGVRTQTEIEEERYAIKALRGDFQELSAPGDANGQQRAQAAVQATRGNAAWAAGASG